MKLVDSNHEVLTTPATAVHRFRELQSIVDEMVRIMDLEGGVGLAAPQIGIGRQIAVIRENPTAEVLVLVNPIITSVQGSPKVRTEGCLSLPKSVYNAFRFPIVFVEYKDIEGNTVTKRFTGLLSQIVQHEVDHLKGKLISRFKKVVYYDNLR